MSDVDVVVLDLDGGAMLQECLASIARQTLQPNRVIVFDNGSRTPTPNATARSEKNLGFAGGANAAVQLATAPFVALINNDVILDDDWLATVRNAIDDKTAAIQTIIRRDADTIDGAGIDISDGTIRQLGHGTSIGTPLPEAWGVSRRRRCIAGSSSASTSASSPTTKTSSSARVCTPPAGAPACCRSRRRRTAARNRPGW